MGIGLRRRGGMKRQAGAAAVALAASFLLAACATASPGTGGGTAERWVPLGQGEDGEAYLDRRSMRRSGGFLTVTVREEISEADPDEASRQVSEVALDCGGRRAAGVSATFHDRRGRVLERYRIPRGEWEWRAVEAGTFDQRVHDAACPRPVAHFDSIGILLS